MASDFDPVVVELPHWPSCPACGGLVSPSRFADMERQDGNLAELERAARAQGFVICAAFVAFVGGAALLLAGVL